MHRSRRILRDETGASRPPVYLLGYSARRRRGGAGRWWATAALLLGLAAAALHRLG